MSGAGGLRAELALALQGDENSVAVAFALCPKLEDASCMPEQLELVINGPPEGRGGGTWGALLAAAVAQQARQQHSAALLAFERTGGYWRILELLSSARRVEPSRRAAYYGQFADKALLGLLLTGVSSRGPVDRELRRCVRNLARCHDLRQPLAPAVPMLVANLEDETLAAESAAALCNLACLLENKERAVECRAVPLLIKQLAGRHSPPAAEDLMACLGVLIGGCQKGLASLFQLASSQGQGETFQPVFRRLKAEESSKALQSLTVDVVSGLCASSPQFREWMVADSCVVKGELPCLLRSKHPDVRMAGLGLAALLVESESFREAFSRSPDGIQALQGILELEKPKAGGFAPSMAPMVTRARTGNGPKEPTQRELTQYLLSKILMI